jgi:surfeit locus 1 family protein
MMRATFRKSVAAVVAILLFTAFVALGTWQLERRAWKLDLIARVNQRVHAAAVQPPLPANFEWPPVTASADEYRHVRVTGVFLNALETLVQASTELGPGYWVLTPLRLDNGEVVLVNRGFVPPERRSRGVHAAGELTGTTTVTGLLRLTEPRGAFLHRNDAAANRWYSRDVQAIATARGLSLAGALSRVAPYFIDQDAAADANDVPSVAPIGGLTVIAFHNSHLIYAITWYTLALMVVAASWLEVRDERRPREPQAEPTIGVH